MTRGVALFFVGIVSLACAAGAYVARVPEAAAPFALAAGFALTHGWSKARAAL